MFRKRVKKVFLIIIAVIALCAAILFFLLRSLALDTAGKTQYAKFRETGAAREVLRTPDERFENLKDYPFTPNYIEVEGLRIHYVDEGPRDADPVLLLHGEPSWSYLYRKMIPPISAAGHRVIAPDLIGFGKSDKLVNPDDFSYQMHVDTMAKFIEVLDLKNITLFCQDWGGLIGLRVAAENEARFARIVAANTALPGTPPQGTFQPTTTLVQSKRKALGAFLGWFLYSQFKRDLHTGDVLQMGSIAKLSPEEVAAYNAPYPDARYLVGVRKFPRIVASQTDKNTEAWKKFAQWEKPFLTAFSDKDPIMRGGDRIFQRVVPGAQNQAHTTIKRASHFLQEDQPEELAQAIVAFIEKTK